MDKKTSQFSKVTATDSTTFIPLIQGNPLGNRVISKDDFIEDLKTSLPEFVQDPDYVHTDNNYTDEDKALVQSAIQEETDPVFNAWDKSTGISITESQISDFGTYEPADGNIQSHISDTTIHVTEDDKSNWNNPDVLYTPTGATVAYTDAGGNFHIDGDIYQNGSVYETHAQQVYTTKDDIILREGATAGLGSALSGLTIKNYDGEHDGSLKIDADGWMRVGDAGSEQKLATIEETPTDGEFAYYDGNDYQLKTRALLSTDIPTIEQSQVNNLTTDLALLAHKDNPLFTGSVTADSFITTGGTPYQFVKGDGTLDSITYVPSDGGITYHVARWFTPTGTFSSTGATVTTTGGQLTSAMVGSKIGVGTDKRIITTYLTTNTCTVDRAFSQDYSGVVNTGWGVYSKHYEVRSDGNIYSYYKTGGSYYYVDANGAIHFENAFSTIYSGSEYKNRNLNLSNDFKILFSSTGQYYDTPDLGLKRESAGTLSIYNGVNSAEYRDVKVRNIFADNTVLQDDAKFYHSTKWFTTQANQTITISANGVTATLSNPVANYQFISDMVGAKLIVNGVGRVITGYTSTSVVTFAVPFLPSMFNQVYDYTLFGVYGKAYQATSGTDTNNYYGTTNNKLIYVDSNNNYLVNSTYGIFNNYLEAGYIGLKTGYFGLGLGTKIVATNQPSSGYQSTPDIGLQRGATGMWTVSDGVNVANLRDIKLRNLYADNIYGASGDSVYTKEDGGSIYWTTKVFTPQVGQTASSTGTTVNITNPVASFQFTSGMVGFKFGFGSEKRKITAYTSASQVTVESAYSQDYVGVANTGWGIYSPIISSNNNVFLTSAGAGANYNGVAEISKQVSTNGGELRLDNVICKINGYYPISWTTGSDSNGTKDLGIKHNSIGVLEIFDGINSGNLKGFIANNTKIGTVYQSKLTVATTGIGVTGISVSHTYNFPATGTILIGGVTSIPYTSKTAGTLLFASTVIPTYPVGTQVLVTSAGSYTEITSDGVLNIKNSISGATVFNILGTSGNLLKVTDVVSDTLLDVVDTNDKTIFSVSNDGSVKQNSITISGITSGSSPYNVMSISKTSCSCVFFDYFVKETSTNAMRSGTLMVVHDGTTVSYTDNSTADLNNSTAGISLSSQISSGYIVLVATVTNGTYTISLGTRKI